MQLGARAVPRGRGRANESAASSAYRSGRPTRAALLPAGCRRTMTTAEERRAATRGRTASFSRCSRVRTRAGRIPRPRRDQANLNAPVPVVGDADLPHQKKNQRSRFSAERGFSEGLTPLSSPPALCRCATASETRRGIDDPPFPRGSRESRAESAYGTVVAPVFRRAEPVIHTIRARTHDVKA